MITKIEIDGFKTFSDFEIEFAPLTIIAGTNASGKSNLFDAMSLLSRLVDEDLKTAFSQQRGEAGELFTRYANDTTSDNISLSVELLLDKTIRDNFGGEATLKYTRLRYEIKIGRNINERGLSDLVVLAESLNPLRHEEDEWINIYIPKKSLENWRPKVKTGKRGVAYIDTSDDRISLRQDGKGGIKKEFSLSNINQAIISVVNSVDFPHALAAKEEIKRWKFLQLNPEDLRKPSSYFAEDKLTNTGLNLAATVHRIKMFEPGLLKSISRRLNSLLPGIVDFDVLDDVVGKQFVVQAKNQDGRTFTSRVLSEGTLRLLTLCVFLYDPHYNGLLCFEEPENGVHPGRLKLTVELLMNLATDFLSDERELRQVIVNTHSTVLVGDAFKLIQNYSECRIWFSQMITKNKVINGAKQQHQVTKMLPVLYGTNQLTLEFNENERKLTLANVSNYLSSQDFEQIIAKLAGNE